MLLSSRLQGGYTLESLSDCALAVGRMLLGEAPPELPPLVASEVESETVWLVAKEQSKYWKNINIKACEPKEGSYLLSIILFHEAHVDSPDFEEFAFAVPGAISTRTFHISSIKSIGRTSQGTQARLHVPEI